MAREEEKDKSKQVEELEAEVNKLKKSLKRKQNRRFLSCSGCLIIFMLICLLAACFIGYVLAKSGLKQVPYFTDWFYNEPEPSRFVSSGELSPAQKDFFSILKQKATETALAQKRKDNLTVNFSLTEEQLTYMLQEQISQEPELDARIKYAQAAILAEGLELFLETEESNNLIATIIFSPALKDGKLDLSVAAFKLGDLRLPKFLGEWTFGFAVEKSLNSLLNFSSDYGKIKSINLKNGEILLEILINDLQKII